MTDPTKTNKVRFEHLEEAVLELCRSMQAMQETSVTTQTLLQELASRSSSRDSDRRCKASKQHPPKDSPPSSPHSTSSRSSDMDASAESENDGSRSSQASDTETNEGRTTATDKTLRMHSRVKLDFPRFVGEDPTVWLDHVKQYFATQEIQGKKKVTLAAYHLEGETNQLWQWYNRSHDGKTISWHKFEKGILRHFGPTDFEDYDKALSKIKQMGTFREYQHEFEKLANRVTGWPKKALLGAFMGGLKEDIAIEVCMFRPKGLKNAIDLAKRQDEKLQRGRKPSGSVSSNTRRMGNAIPTNTTTPLLTTKLAPDIVVKLSHVSLKLKSPFDEKKDDKEELSPTDIPTDPLISLHALSGSIGNHTMLVRALVNRQEINALIDGGSSHNCINQMMVNQLNLAVTPITPFYVRVASGEKFACQVKYEKVPICIQGFFFETTLFALPIRGLDLVLGYQWLEGLGCVVHDYARRSMEFVIGNQKFIIQAKPVGPSMDVDVNALLLEWKHGTELFCLAAIESEPALPVDSTPNLNPKIQAILLEHQQPKNITALWGFLGLTGYYRKFVRNYGLLARPLTQLLRKGQFAWSEEANLAFASLKTAMTTTPVLALPNFSKDFMIEMDASGLGVGAVLSQNGRPIAFLGKAIGPAKKSWSTYEKEMLAVLEDIKSWRPYLLGRRFKICTDQKSLRHLLEQRITTPEQQKWVAKLLGFDYEIVYKPRRENGVADVLSRSGLNYELVAISGPIWEIWDDLRKATKEDAILGPLERQLQADPLSVAGHNMKNWCIMREGRILVLEVPAIKEALLHEFHDSAVGGHSGILHTYKWLSLLFHWRGMKKDVRLHIQQCDTCQRNKYDTRQPAGLLEPLQIPSGVWTDVSMDFIGGLPKSAGKNSIFVVVDRLTKFAHFIALAQPYTARDVADAFVRNVVKLHGLPSSIVSDRDCIFMSHFWRELFRLQGTTMRTSSAYHSETDGQTEVVNRCLEQYLRCFVHTTPKRWEAFLSWAKFSYNTSFHSSIQMTPFEALYGRPPPVLNAYIPGSTAPKEILGSRWVQSASGRVKEIMVRWNILPAEDATWEPLSTIKEQFPTFNLEDIVQAYVELDDDPGKLTDVMFGEFAEEALGCSVVKLMNRVSEVASEEAKSC
ncbi:uncharacterized protein LOC122289342 [Carya illinoinensis]|uniref:uncharacterized protein LOC122289342 n=1 Tax=Carya illinoinensis TaxID=32201 RepID=UPI001C71EB6B|nr:uncharacterized protein LOC122289342 [Carya illinoinensis]